MLNIISNSRAIEVLTSQGRLTVGHDWPAGPERSGESRDSVRTKQPTTTASRICVLRRPGGYGGAAAPDPIPNSVVKRSSANGTSS